MQLERRRRGHEMALLAALSFFGASGYLQAVNSPPSAVSVTPSSGSGIPETFAFLYSDPDGASDLPWVEMMFNTVVSSANGCYAHVATTVVYLRTDDGTAWLGPVGVGYGSSTVENSQCRINAPSSSIFNSGNNRTINVSITFKTAFAGAKNIYMQTNDVAGLSTGWQSRGTWTVSDAGNQSPSAVSVTPSSGSGSAQTFAFRYSDPNGATDLPWVQMMFNTAVSAANGCYAYVASTVVYLRTNNGAGWLGPVGVGYGSSSVENAQCRINAPSSSIVNAGNDRTVNLSITFKAPFAGAKNIYLLTNDLAGRSSGWQQRGIWTVPAGPPPLTITTTSPLPSGTQSVFYSQTLEATGGTSPYTWSVISGSLPPGLTLSSGGVLSGTPTAAGDYSFTVQVSGGGTVAKAFSLTIAAPANFAPEAVSVTPDSGSGTNQTFTFLYSDPNGFADLPWAQMLFHESLDSPVNSCYVHYDRALNAVWLLNDEGTTWLGPVVLGLVGSVENSQCKVTAGDSSSSKVGTNLTVTLALTFNAALTGAWNIYMQTQDVGGLASGWQQRGTWILGTGSASAIAPPLPSGTPGVADSQTLAATGGPTPYTRLVLSGLPPGLTLSSAVW